MDYLDTLGVNEELASFVEVLSLDKDQRLYLKWLQSLNTFLH